ISPQGIDRRYVGRLSSAEHAHVVSPRSESMPEIVHQFANSAALAQLASEFGESPRTNFGITRHQATSARLSFPSCANFSCKELGLSSRPLGQHSAPKSK